METQLMHFGEYLKHVVLTGLFIAGTFGLMLTGIGFILKMGGKR